MKILALVVVAALLGTGAGVASTAFRLQTPDAPLDAAATDDARLADLPSDGRRPRVEVDAETYDFGVMERGATGSHAFVFTNRGDYPLKLTQGDTSCKCTISKLAHDEVPPGESVDVTLEWNSKAGTSEFRQTATILTNDPTRPRVPLVVQGQLSQSVVVQPADVVFSRLAIGEATTADVTLICYTREDFEITEHRFTNEATREYFDVAWKPDPAAAAEDARAKSALRLTVSVKPGLPVGGFSQQLVLATNATPENEITIPIEGRVTGDVALFGPGWNAERGMLVVGTVKNSAGLDRKLTLLVHQPEGDAPVEVRVAKVTPPALQVELGAPREAGAGRTMLPVHIRIAKGTAPISRVGPGPEKMGEIVLETSHPRAPRVQLHVRFAVVD